MEFSKQLNAYMETIHCNGKELSEASGLSPAVISRYRTGERKPDTLSDNLIQLASGLSSIASSQQLPNLSYDEIYSSLQHALHQKESVYKYFTTNYETLIKTLSISMKDLATATNFDSSYLYRVRSGHRHPKDLPSFTYNFCKYITDHYQTADDRKKIAHLLGCTTESLEPTDACLSALQSWLLHVPTKNTDQYAKDFLKKLNTFNLDEYIRTIHFDELKVPTAPFQLPSSKNYYGITEGRKSELDFFKSTVLSRSKEPIFMCSDMPMLDMAEDADFNKKWMFGIAMSLKKGLHLNIIHNIDRPFEEMMLGLEAWIPIYMTGQISPYHLPNINTDIYHHLHYVSGAAALIGECIDGYPEKTRYHLTNNKEDLAYYKQKAACLLNKAEPLMDIYTIENEARFKQLAQDTLNIPGKRHNILCSPPLYTLSAHLLDKILSRSTLSEEEQSDITNYVLDEHAYASALLENNIIYDEVPKLSREEFEKHPAKLFLSGAFYEREILYTYDDYLEHLRLTANYQTQHPNYTCRENDHPTFRNIQIHIVEDNHVLVSKAQSPMIHFMIRHPKMVQALQNFASDTTQK